MYAITLQVYGSSATEVYQELVNIYKLPTLAMLVTSLDRDISWQACTPETQVYFLDGLKEPNRRNVFQIRFKTNNKESKNFTSVFVSLDTGNETVHILTLQFPTRGHRACSSNVIACLKRSREKEIEFEIEGYGERETLRFIREHSLSAFQWNESLRRYLHVTDHFNEVKEVKKFR